MIECGDVSYGISVSSWLVSASGKCAAMNLRNILEIYNSEQSSYFRVRISLLEQCDLPSALAGSSSGWETASNQENGGEGEEVDVEGSGDDEVRYRSIDNPSLWVQYNKC